MVFEVTCVFSICNSIFSSDFMCVLNITIIIYDNFDINNENII